MVHGMDAITLVALLFSIIAAYLGINAYLSKEELDAESQLLATKSTLGKSDKE